MAQTTTNPARGQAAGLGNAISLAADAPKYSQKSPAAQVKSEPAKIFRFKPTKRVLAVILRAAVRKVAAYRRRAYGEVLPLDQFAPAFAAVLVMDDYGKYYIKGRVLIWPGLDKDSLSQELRGAGIEIGRNDPTMAYYLDWACNHYRKRKITPAELGRMLHLTSAERAECKASPILPYDETAGQRKRRLRKGRADRQTNRRRAMGGEPRTQWLKKNDISATKPWEAEGVSRATWYRSKAKLSNSTGSDETGPCPTSYLYMLRTDLSQLQCYSNSLPCQRKNFPSRRMANLSALPLSFYLARTTHPSLSRPIQVTVASKLASTLLVSPGHDWYNYLMARAVKSVPAIAVAANRSAACVRHIRTFS